MTVSEEAEATCPGCGLTMPADESAVYDGYYNTSPECWSVYSEALEPEFSDPYLYGKVHQLTVDAYAVQHAGGEHPDKSVAIHLTGLHLVLERGFRPARLPPLFQKLSDRIEAWPHFVPPATLEAPTVLDVALSESSAEHVNRVRTWAEKVWVDWSEHHREVAAFASRHLDPVRR